MSKNWVKYNGKVPTQQIIMMDQKDKESQRLLEADKKKKDNMVKDEIEGEKK
jgi:hypothetical protein